MPNSYFKFKAFTIHQQKAAMKVTTDACLFGAWIAKNSPQFFQPFNCLDIGTGTGLLSLMYIQQHHYAMIDAIEIEALAAQEAASNFSLTVWKQQIKLIHNSIQLFSHNQNKKYAFIFSNPPFYDNDLKSIYQQRNIALHSTALSLEELIYYINFHLDDEGCFAVLLPFTKTAIFEELCSAKNLFIHLKTSVKQTENHTYFRTMFMGGKKPLTNQKQSEIVIKENNEYSNNFIELLKDYYLFL